MLRSSLVALLALAAIPAHAQSTCDSIANEPVHYDVVFERDIQPYFGGVVSMTIPRCETCHVSGSAGGMNLAPANVRLELLGADGNGEPSLNYPSYRRIVPERPFASLVYVRIHCDDSPPGRMPPGANGSMDPDFLRFQALVHDWIALGAIMVDTDRRFIGSFESIR